MKNFVFPSVFILLYAIVIMNINSGCSDNLNVLLVTGGHSFDTTQFFYLFSSYERFSVDTISQPGANKQFEELKNDMYDVIVFYDMWQDITENQKNALYKLLENGTGMVFLHHSLVSYQQWDEFKRILGGKYWQEGFTKDSLKLSGYEHDLDLHVRILDPDHPVTRDMQDFQIYDEGYSNVEIIPTVIPLLETTHPSCSKYVAWANEYKQSRIIFIMLGHDQKAYNNPAFQMLVQNAINWVSRLPVQKSAP